MKKELVVLVLGLTALVLFVGCTSPNSETNSFSFQDPSNVTSAEKKICSITYERDLVSVSKCISNDIIVYEKKENSKKYTDAGRSVFYDESANEICQYSYFAVGWGGKKNPCPEKLLEWNPNFDLNSCVWIKICSSGGL